MPKPTFSIVTPVHNGALTIGRAVDSLVSQSEKEWEHVIVDDNSTDCTAEIIKGFGDSRIRYFRQQRRGRSIARNWGIDESSGDFLLFLDSDDWLLPGALHDHLSVFRDHPEAGVSVGDGYFCANDGTIIVSLSERRGPVTSGRVVDRIVVDSGLVGATHSAAIRRRVLREHAIRFNPNLMFGEDWLFWIEVAQHTTFQFFDSPTCMYRWHQESTTQTLMADSRKDQLCQGRMKVLEAPFFSALPESVRERFFYQLVIEILAGRPGEQEDVLTGRQFAGLSPVRQAKLLRLAASEYLVAGSHVGAAKKWLRKASYLEPFDPRQRLLGFSAVLNPTLAGLGIRVWRKMRQRQPIAAPTPPLKGEVR